MKLRATSFLLLLSFSLTPALRADESSQWMWHGAFPWVYSHAESSWWYMKAGTDGKFYAWKQSDGEWYLFNDYSNQWVSLQNSTEPGGGLGGSIEDDSNASGAEEETSETNATENSTEPGGGLGESIEDDSNASGAEEETSVANATENRLLWKKDHDRIEDATATLGQNERIYVGPYALDSKTGEIVWELNTTVHFNHSLVNPRVVWQSPPPIVDENGTVYIVWHNLESKWNRGTDKALYAVDSVSGKTSWRWDARQNITSSPALSSEGVLYFFAVDDIYEPTIAAYMEIFGNWPGKLGRKVFALNSRDGSHVWKQDIPNRPPFSEVFPFFSPGILKGKNQDTSNFPYSTHGITLGKSGNVYLFEMGYSPSNRSRVECLEPVTGSYKWYVDGFSGARNASSVTIDENETIYISCNGLAFAFDASLDFGPENSGNQSPWREKWKNSTGLLGQYFQPIVGFDNKIYVGGCKYWGTTAIPVLYCLNRKTGEKIWEFLPSHLEGIFSTPALSADNTLYFTSGRQGVLYAIDGATGQKKWDYNLGSSMSSPLIGKDGTVFVGTTDRGFCAFKGDSGPANTAWPMYQQNPQRTGQMPKE
jgi:outer membrane protein assembly factor BamB